MKLIAYVGSAICILATIITYSLIALLPQPIRGDDKMVSIVADEKKSSYSLIIDNLLFINSEQKAIIRVVPILPTKEASFEVLYSEDLDEYSFSAAIDNSTIRISMDTDRAHPIKTFEATIYAPINNVQASGRGYRLFIEEPSTDHISVVLSGDILANIRLRQLTTLMLAVAGSSAIELSGSSPFVHIALSGNPTVHADYLLSSAASVSIFGSGNVSLSVSEWLEVSLGGSSVLSYYGSPDVRIKKMDSDSMLTQYPSTLSALNY